VPVATCAGGAGAALCSHDASCHYVAHLLLLLLLSQALENLRKLRLEKTQEAREMRLKLETLKSHKDAAAKLSIQVAEGRSKADALKTEIKALEVWQ
jgi:hypothetical protein